jgi:hypothetical protein
MSNPPQCADGEYYLHYCAVVHISRRTRAVGAFLRYNHQKYFLRAAEAGRRTVRCVSQTVLHGICGSGRDTAETLGFVAKERNKKRAARRRPLYRLSDGFIWRKWWCPAARKACKRAFSRSGLDMRAPAGLRPVRNHDHRAQPFEGLGGIVRVMHQKSVALPRPGGRRGNHQLVAGGAEPPGLHGPNGCPAALGANRL